MSKFIKALFVLCISIVLANSAKAMDVVTLDLSNQGITDLGQVFIAEGVTEVFLDSNNFTDLAPLKLPSTLKFLSLTRNNLQNIDGLQLPEGLETLFLTVNQIEDLRGTSFPNTLVDLNLAANQIDSFDKLGNLPDSLIELDLSENPILGGVLNTPASLKFLRINQIQVKKLTDISINNANNLELIEFLNGEITDISDIGNFNIPPKLRLLELGGHEIPDINPIINATNLRGISFDRVASVAGLQLPPNLETAYIIGSFADLNGLIFNDKLELLVTGGQDLLGIDSSTILPGSLKKLSIGLNVADLSGLSVPEGLEVLSLSFNPNLDQVSKFPNFPKSLRKLNLQRVGLQSLDGLKIPKNLRDLSLDDTPITDIPRSFIPRGSKLKRLSANETNIPKSNRKQIRRRIRRRASKAKVKFNEAFSDLFFNEFNLDFDFPFLN